MSEERFALIREPEAEALKVLSPLAAKAFIAIKFGRRDGEKIPFGVRDLEEWGMKRSAAGRALAELVEAGLIKIFVDSAFGKKRLRRVFEVTHRRVGEPLQSRQRDKPPAHSPAGGTMEPATVPRTGLSGALQSHQRDTTRTSLLPSGQEGREGGKDKSEEERAEGVAALREQLLRVDKAAEAVAMTGSAFMQKAGGPKPADFLARKFERGDLTAMQLRAALADPPKGSARESEGRTRERERVGDHAAMAGAA